MQQLFSNALGLMATGGVVVGTAIVGALYVIGLAKKAKEDEKGELVKTLKEHVEALQKKQGDDHKESQEKIAKMAKDHKDQIEEFEKKFSAMSDEIKELRTEKKTLAEVAMGRDASTQKFLKEAGAAISAIADTHKLVGEVAKGTNMLIAVASSFLKPEEVARIKLETGYQISRK